MAIRPHCNVDYIVSWSLEAGGADGMERMAEGLDVMRSTLVSKSRAMDMMECRWMRLMKGCIDF